MGLGNGINSFRAKGQNEKEPLISTITGQGFRRIKALFLLFALADKTAVVGVGYSQ